MKKRARPFKRLIIILFIIFALFIIVFFGARLYLLINLLLGNDVLIRLSVDKENLFLLNNQSQEIQVTTNLLANPFCTIDCDYSFIDLSNDLLIDRNNFSVKTIEPISKKYSLSSPLTGTGQKIYRFEIRCSSKKTYLCDTKGEVQTRTSIITLNYELTEEEKQIKNQSKQKLEEFYSQFVIFNSKIQELSSFAADLSRVIDLNIAQESQIVKSKLDQLNYTINLAINQWKQSDISALQSTIIAIGYEIEELDSTINKSKSTLITYTDNYNFLIDSLNTTRYNLITIKSLNLTNSTIMASSNLISNFNNLSNSMNNKILLSEKQTQATDILKQSSVLQSQAIQEQASADAIYSITDPIQSNTPVKLSLNFSFVNVTSQLILPDSISYCCLLNKCDVCCNDNCNSNKSLYPIIFIHGHDFNERISAEYNLHLFSDFQKKLEEQNYIDMGSLLSSNNEAQLKGIWGKTNYPITTRASYYFDTLINPKGNTILQTKKDNIDTYAIRLNDIINEVKFRTNKDKVILISHSMGGLVIRRYLQVFGENDIEKAILIASPNHGISGKSLSYCSIFGSKAECEDMDESSLFINKLTNGKKPTIPIYNLIGIGCNMDEETGDGILKNSSAYLETAQNYYINGSCNELGFVYLHTDITNIYKYPEVYNKVVEILKI